jgi:hypothetical protein
MGGAPKSAILWIAISMRPRGRLSARHMRLSNSGKRMLTCGDLADRRAALSPISAPPTILAPLPTPSILALEARLGRSDRRRLAWALRSSASSWQGLLVDPGGAPAPPEYRASEA